MDKEDAQALWTLDQDPEVMHYLNGGKMTTMDDVHNIFIPRMLKYRNEKNGWGIWHVSDKVTEEYLGWVLARPMQFFTDTPLITDIELGWRFFRKHWGKGYATEAAIAIKNSLISQGGISHISALAVEDNLASTKVMEKIGMDLLKRYRHLDPIGDFDAVHYQLSVSSC
jgi:RimJ/RimL family protein N-acetyltransferase